MSVSSNNKTFKIAFSKMKRKYNVHVIVCKLPVYMVLKT